MNELEKMALKEVLDLLKSFDKYSIWRKVKSCLEEVDDSIIADRILKNIDSKIGEECSKINRAKE